MYQIRAYASASLRYDNDDADVLVLNDQQMNILRAVLTLIDSDLDLDQINGVEASRLNREFGETFDKYTEPYGFVMSCDYVAD